VVIRDPRNLAHSIIFREHAATTKGIAWSPLESNLIATGGGTADRRILLWDIGTLDIKQEVDSKSQVGGLQFTRDGDLISLHGYSQNEVTIWNTKGMSKRAVLRGHTARVLYSALSPDHDTLLTGSPDETLRFWKIGFSDRKKSPKQKEPSFGLRGIR
jgi:cell division cycle 20-like protein 1 (cofactor of APC complex)